MSKSIKNKKFIKSKENDIIVGFKGNMLTGFNFKFLYKKDEKIKPVKRRPGNPRPAQMNFYIGKNKN